MNSESKKMIHKETFCQAAFEGVPAHYVVQYYIDGEDFCEAVYFSSLEKAKAFEEELKNET